MDFHYNGTVAPLLERVSFIKSDIDTIKDEYIKWRSEFDNWNLNFHVEEVGGDLFTVICRLLPFKDYKKVLIMPTNSEWVAYTDNNLPADSEKGVVVSRRLKSDAIDVCALINSFGKVVNGWGGGGIQFYEGGNLKRSIFLSPHLAQVCRVSKVRKGTCALSKRTN